MTAAGWAGLGIDTSVPNSSCRGFSRLRRTRVRSFAEHGNCVEAAGDGRVVAVRDSKDSTGEYLVFKPQAWREFAARLKDEG
jgi:hypothetical protein